MHVGFAVVCVGVAASSAYRKELVELTEPGGTLKIDGYAMRYDGYRLDAVNDYVAAITELTVWQDGRLVAHLEAEQRSHPNMLFPELRDAFVQLKSRRDADPAAFQSEVLGLYALMTRLEAQAGREVKTPSTEVAIHKSFSLASLSRFGEDFYVTPLGVDPATGQANFRVFVNPMVNFLWLGGLILVVGATVCVLPDRGERRRLEASMALEDRQVA